MHSAHVLGVAFDGDADRALFVDERGSTINGDHIMLMLAREHKKQGTLAGEAVVGTVMSNVGLERALRAAGIELLRAPVGDLATSYSKCATVATRSVASSRDTSSISPAIPPATVP